MCRLFFHVLLLIVLSSPANSPAETVSYEFDIDYREINVTGKPVTAMVIDGKIPGPTIEADLNDTLRVTFNNRMDVETSIHWHGVLLPNDQDGVPYLTTPPIAAGGSLTFEYPVTHTGTYWYHAHTGLQEQRGLYGALVFRDPDETYRYDRELVLVLSDWTDEQPGTVLRNLKREDDYYALKKDTVQSWQGVLENGRQAIKNRIEGAWIRMGPMDLSDVGYDAFLVNGEQSLHNTEIKQGETVRLRIINASASSYFHVGFSGGDMLLIEADGVPVEEKTVERLRLATAETYDVLVHIRDDKRYELRATAQDVSGYASWYLGAGETVPVLPALKPNLYLVSHGSRRRGRVIRADRHGHMHHTSEYAGLKSKKRTSFDAGRETREIDLTLTGSMERYTWSFDNRTLTEVDKIRIKQGEIVRFNLVNETMMHHPIHLHGHFFRVLNGQGEFAPLKHTVNVPPLDTVTIEFAANEEKDWFFHCHNLYHMKSGMARVVSYIPAGEDDYFNSNFFRYHVENDDPWYRFADMAFQSQMMAGRLWAYNRRNGFEMEYDYDYGDEYDIDVTYHRQITRFLALYAGAGFEREESAENRGITGVSYVLPLMIDSELRIDTSGHFRLELESELQVTKRTRFHWNWNTDDEYRVLLNYEINKRTVITGGYDSDFKLGAGFEYRY
jgi:FtsP/CotA-like multicopper oxidase with cupredoxin domain